MRPRSNATPNSAKAANATQRVAMEAQDQEARKEAARRVAATEEADRKAAAEAQAAREASTKKEAEIEAAKAVAHQAYLAEQAARDAAAREEAARRLAVTEEAARKAAAEAQAAREAATKKEKIQNAKAEKAYRARMKALAASDHMAREEAALRGGINGVTPSLLTRLRVGFKNFRQHHPAILGLIVGVAVAAVLGLAAYFLWPIMGAAMMTGAAIVGLTSVVSAIASLIGFPVAAATASLVGGAVLVGIIGAAMAVSSGVGAGIGARLNKTRPVTASDAQPELELPNGSTGSIGKVVGGTLTPEVYIPSHYAVPDQGKAEELTSKYIPAPVAKVGFKQ